MGIYHGAPKPRFLEVFMVNNLLFTWPIPLFFMVLGAHGICIFIYIYIAKQILPKIQLHVELTFIRGMYTPDNPKNKHRYQKWV